MSPPPTAHRRLTDRRGFTLIEAALAVVVVALVLTGALEATGAIARAQLSQQTGQFAANLAESLLSEVCSDRYSDPSSTAGLLGTPANAFDRVNFLSLDDYAGFSESPPRGPGGLPITTDASWSRSVSIVYVTPASPTTVSLVDLGLRRVTVTVSRNGRVVATRTALKCRDD